MSNNNKEEKKQIRISLKTLTMLTIFSLILLVIVGIGYFYNYRISIVNNFITSITNENYKKVFVKDKIYYQRLNQNLWKGFYRQDNFNQKVEISNIMKVISYKEYIEAIDSINNSVTNKEINSHYSNKHWNYIILCNTGSHNIDLISCIQDDDKIIIYGDEDPINLKTINKGYFIAIPTNMPVGTKIEYKECYSDSQINSLQNNNNDLFMLDEVYKPIIYLYPTKEAEISVKLLKNENLTCSYPKYKDRWNVLAHPSGILKELETNRQLYSLYYEYEVNTEFTVKNEGFIVKGENIIPFLEEKLKILGLNEIEAEEFIIYWLPKLQNNKYNYIRFATIDEINSNMPLEINPKPDTMIRILMTFKKLESPIDVQEQYLETQNRTGFVAVEWGGTEIK